MKYLSLIQFLKLFYREPIPFSQWIKKAQVKSGTKLIPLEIYRTSKQISLEQLKKLYDHIVHRDEYLQRFYRTSLMFNDITIKDTPMSSSHLDNNTKVQYKNNSAKKIFCG